MNTWHKLGLVGALYVAQGLPFGFFTQSLPVLLREQGLSLEQIGLTSLLALPWAFKFLWAPLADRWYWPALGRRRSWLLPIQGMTILTLLLAAFTDPADSLRPVFIVVFLCNLLAASQDIATDGMAVQLLKPTERGLGNGVQVAGYRVGMILGGGALLIFFESLGWRLSFTLMALLVALCSLPVLLFNENRHLTVAARPADKRPLVWAFLREPGVLAWLGVIVIYKLGDAVGAGMVRPFLVDLGLGLADIGWLLGTAGFAASLFGALLGGWLTSLWGGYRALLAFGVLQALSIMAYALAAIGMDSTQWLYGLTILENLTGGMATAAFFTLMMSACRRATEGTDYTVQASVFVIATGTAVALSGFLAAGVGYAAYFVISGGTALLALLPVAIAASRGGFRAHRLNQPDPDVAIRP